MPKVLCLQVSIAKPSFYIAALICLTLVAGCAKEPKRNESWGVPKNISMAQAQTALNACSKGRTDAERRRCMEEKGFQYGGKLTADEHVRLVASRHLKKKGQWLTQTRTRKPPGMSNSQANAIFRDCSKTALAIKRAPGTSTKQHDTAVFEARKTCLKKHGFIFQTRRITRQ